jgi:hypothetical protein
MMHLLPFKMAPILGQNNRAGNEAAALFFAAVPEIRLD